MDLILRSGSREEKVRVRRDDDVYEVTIGDRLYRVEAATARRGAQSLRSLRIEGVQHEVAVRHQGEGVYWVSTPQGAAYGQPTQRSGQVFGSGGPRALQVGGRFVF